MTPSNTPQPLDGLTLLCLAREWQAALVGARIQKVQQFSATDWSMSVFHKGQAGKLFFSVRPEMPFCTVFWGDKSASALPNATFPGWLKPMQGNPTGFCMLLRKHLVGAQIRDVSVLDGERVLNIRVENATELGFQSKVVLSLELMGKHSNALLLTATDESDSAGAGGAENRPRILGVAHAVGEHQSRHRELAGGLPYVPPPRPAKKRFWHEVSQVEWESLLSSEPLSAWGDILSQQVLGLGKQMTQQILLALSQHEPNWQNVLQRFGAMLSSNETLSPAWKKECFTLKVQDAPPSTEGWYQTNALPDPVNAAIRSYYWQRYEARHLQDLKKSLSFALERQKRQVSRRLEALVCPEEERPERWQAMAERLLLALNSQEVPPHPHGLLSDLNVLREMESEQADGWQKWERHPSEAMLPVRVADMYPFTLEARWDGECWHEVNLVFAPWTVDEPPVVCPVQQDQPWMDQIQQWFKRARKMKSRLKLMAQDGERYQARLDYLDEVACWLLQSETMAALFELKAEFEESGWLNTTVKAGKNKHKPGAISEMAGILPLWSSDGVPIWVGRTSQGNGKLLSRWAKPYDVWAHVHQMAGSHVLVRPIDGQPLSDQTLLEALQMAVHFSVAREGSQVPVVFTEYRHVRKIPGSYPGHVTYKQERQAYINPDFSIVEKVLSQSANRMAVLPETEEAPN